MTCSWDEKTEEDLDLYVDLIPIVIGNLIEHEQEVLDACDVITKVNDVRL